MPLDSSRLSSRVRDLLRGQPGPPGTRDEARPLDERDLPPGSGGPRYVPDDEVTVAPEAPTGCVVIERHYDLDTPHGRFPVGHYARTVDRAVDTLRVLAADGRTGRTDRPPRPGRLVWEDETRADDGAVPAGVPTSGPLLFFDLETTGLSGGAGTVAFLAGCGYFDEEGFHTRQYFLSGYEAEHELLVSLGAFTRRFAGLVSFNGRTFDVPLIEMRYAFHRIESPFQSMPHVDMLPPARRLWRRRDLDNAGDPSWGSSRAESASCALGALEEAVLGVQRFGDVPGMEIPSRYFHFLRTGDMTPLDAVLEHNRLDLVSLAALTATAMRLVEEGPSAVASASQALAMGTIHERCGRADLAEDYYVRAAGTSPGQAVQLRADALRRLALSRRRRRRFDQAAEAWVAMLDAGLGGAADREARLALAVHHEHRTRDLSEARRLARQALATETDGAACAALRHRLARIERKLERLKIGSE